MATVKEVLSNQEVAEEFFSKETPEEAQAFLQERGVEISLDEIKEIGAALEKMQDGELSEDDLENVAGGGVIRDAYDDIVSIGKEIFTRRNMDKVKRWFRRW
ncbi:MAG TPA: hypothetical protein DCZ91_03630 [Lachnospiraceae bacterium]|nr:hypothetical protein [Lachnospiraceae bacterium]